MGGLKLKTTLEKAVDSYRNFLEDVRELPQPRIYRNSTPVVEMNGVPLGIWDVMTAAVISNLNILLVGERGEGKTQLQAEIMDGFFGGNATYIRMRDNFRSKDLFEVYNLGKLFSGKGTTLEAKEKTLAIANALTVIDEINRAHEKVQNQVYDIYDGYIIFDGPKGPEKIQLGRSLDNGLNFHCVIASANINAARYASTNPMDPALLDRSHVILNVDNFVPSTTDYAVALSEVTSPKVIDYKNKDHTETIVHINKRIMNTKISLDGLIAMLYLSQGINHCLSPKNPAKSKRAVLSSLPGMCEGCNELGKGCGYIYPVSMRSEKAIITLARGLKVVADAKSNPERLDLRVRYQDILTAFKIVAPYSGMLDEQWVKNHYLGNQQFAIDVITEKISEEITTRKDAMSEAYLEASKGSLSEVQKNRFKDRWSFFADFLVAVNSIAKSLNKDIKTLTPEEREKHAMTHPVLRWIL